LSLHWPISMEEVSTVLEKDCLAPTRGPGDFSPDHFPFFIKCGKMRQGFQKLEEGKMSHLQLELVHQWPVYFGKTEACTSK
jgi:hypothetical protein